MSDKITKKKVKAAEILDALKHETGHKIEIVGTRKIDGSLIYRCSN